MYRPNYLKRNVLITPDEVIFHAPTDQKIDERSISQSIIVAEERFIANALCDAFYEDFISKKNVTITTENKAIILEKMNRSFILEDRPEIDSSKLKIGMIINAIELVDDEWYRKLWNRFLWPLTAECVDTMAIVPSWLRTTDSGQQLNNPQSMEGNGKQSASGSAKDIQVKVANAMQNRIDPLIERMRLWICQNKQHFPLYCKDCADCGCGENNSPVDGVSAAGKTNWIMGIYND